MASLLMTLLPAAMSVRPCAAIEAGREEPVGLDSEAIFTAFGFSAEDRGAVAAGRILSVDREAVLPTELAAAVAMRLPLPTARFADLVREGLPMRADPGMRAYAEILGETPGEEWENAGFEADDRPEAARLFAVEPGAEFNLSATEISAVREVLQGRQPEDAEAVAVASAAYRAMLVGRHAGYRSRGVDGLSPYQRADGASFPADELRRIASTVSAPAPLAPFVSALGSFPAQETSAGQNIEEAVETRTINSGAVEHRFYWKKTEVNDRPAFILAHIALFETAQAVWFCLREYYVGHSYNVLEQVGIAVSTTEGTDVLAVNSTVTDRIAGMFSGLARRIGSGRARMALEAYFANIRDRAAPHDRPLTR
jgi:hypothetical protein